MNSAIAAVLVGVLKAFGWQSLIIKVGQDTLRYAAKKADNELAKALLNDIADALQNPQKAVAQTPPP